MAHIPCFGYNGGTVKVQIYSLLERLLEALLLMIEILHDFISEIDQDSRNHGSIVDILSHAGFLSSTV